MIGRQFHDHAAPRLHGGELIAEHPGNDDHRNDHIDKDHYLKEELPDWVNADWQTSLFKNLINYYHVKLDIKIRKCDNKTIREKKHTILKDIVNMKQYIVDAFTDRPFSGNPAAVCVMDSWPSEEAMMKLAMENNLSETAFIVKEEAGYHLRWFTPGTEVELCGHATLASSYVILTFCEPESLLTVWMAIYAGLFVYVNPLITRP